MTGINSEVFKMIQDSRRPDTVDINGDLYATGNLSLMRPLNDEDPKMIKLTTLQGLVDLIKSDGYMIKTNLMLQIVGPNEIKLFGHLREKDNQRFSFAKAVPIVQMDTSDNFNEWLEQEEMSLFLQAYFQSDEGKINKKGKLDDDKAKVINAVSSVVDGTSVTFDDDHTVQEVTLTTGAKINGKAKEELPNPVELAPFRTFPEIKKQPTSKFILRIMSGRKSGTEPMFKLMAADGGVWQLEAVAAIKAWFKGAKLPENVKIIA